MIPVAVLNLLQCFLWYAVTKDLSLDMLLERLIFLNVCYPSNWWCEGAFHNICAKLGDVFNAKPIS